MIDELSFDEMLQLENDFLDSQFFENELSIEELTVLHSVMYQINKSQSLLS